MTFSIKLVCTDVDHTVYGDLEATARFRDFWHDLPPSHRPLLCYNSGRLVEDQLELIACSPLAQPDFVIGGVGTQIYDLKRRRFRTEYWERLSLGWDGAKVLEVMSRIPRIEPQPPRYQTEHKSSWFLHNASDDELNAIRGRLQDAGLEATVVYSSSRDLDVLPARADKGDALRWLCGELGVEPAQVVVAGDTGNDVHMFQVPGVRGVVVANAKPELLEATRHLPVFRSSSVEADGVVEGLRHFGVGRNGTLLETRTV